MIDRLAKLSRDLSVRGSILFADGTAQEITGEHIASFSINESAVGNSILPIGTACSSSFNLQLLNISRQFEKGGEIVGNRTLESAVITLEMGAADNKGRIDWYPICVFVVDDISAPEQSITITLTGSDRMNGTLSEEFSDSSSYYPCTVFDLLKRIAVSGKVELVAGTFPNSDTVIEEMPEWNEGVTYRDVAGCISAIAGGFSRINRVGKLEIVSLENTATHQMGANRYITFERQGISWGPLNTIKLMSENEVVERYTANENILDTVSNTIEISQNPLLNDLTAAKMLESLKGLVINGASIKWQGDPSVMPGDVFEMTDKRGRNLSVRIAKQTLNFSPGFSMTSSCTATGDAKTAGQSSSMRIITPSGALNTASFEGAINAIRNRISVSANYENAEVREGEGLLFENNNPESPDYGALYMGAGIWAIADSKDADGNWEWVNAATGSGIVANVITAGVLNAALVRIIGEVAGFEISSNGFTNGNLIQLMSDGRIYLSGFEIADLEGHPFMQFVYDGITAFHVGEGTFAINQTFNANGNVFFPNLPTTSNPPNLYVGSGGQLYRSTWYPSTTGGSGSGDYIDFGVELSKYVANVGDSITATSNLTGATVTSYEYRIFKDWDYQRSYTSTSKTYTFTVSSAGDWFVEVYATISGGDIYSAQSATVVVGGGTVTGLTVTPTVSTTSAYVGQFVSWDYTATGITGSIQSNIFRIYRPGDVLQKYGSSRSDAYISSVSSGEYYIEWIIQDNATIVTARGGNVTVSYTTPTSGTVTTTVNMRSGPSTNYSIVTTLTSGTKVTITGSLVNDSSGGSIPWWPVRYYSSEPEEYYGYIRSDYITTS